MFEKNLCLIVKEGSIYSLADKENGREGSTRTLYNVLTHPVSFWGPLVASRQTLVSFDLPKLSTFLFGFGVGGL
jgi:hypothetical protein